MGRTDERWSRRTNGPSRERVENKAVYTTAPVAGGWALGRGSNELGRGSNELGRGCNDLGRGSNKLGRSI